MAISRAQRREQRRPRMIAAFTTASAEAVLDLLELTELAWHDCYDEVSPPEDVVDDILVCARGDLAALIQAARLAVTDRRDLTMWAQAERARSSD